MKNENNDYQVLAAETGAAVKMWTNGVPVEDEAKKQLLATAQMPFIFKHLAVMPDVHLGKGSTIGSVIPTLGAVIPAAVGVDIGCGMMAVRTTLNAADLPDDLAGLRSAIEVAVPHGRTSTRSGRDKGAWHNPPDTVNAAWQALSGRFDAMTEKYRMLKKTNNHKHLGTLGTGNHFIEVCLGGHPAGQGRRQRRAFRLAHAQAAVLAECAVTGRPVGLAGPGIAGRAAGLRIMVAISQIPHRRPDR